MALLQKEIGSWFAEKIKPKEVKYRKRNGSYRKPKEEVNSGQMHLETGMPQSLLYKQNEETT